jgi:hypothetical protein
MCWAEWTLPICATRTGLSSMPQMDGSGDCLDLGSYSPQRTQYQMRKASRNKDITNHDYGALAHGQITLFIHRIGPGQSHTSRIFAGAFGCSSRIGSGRVVDSLSSRRVVHPNMLWWSSQSKIMQFVYHIGKTKSGQNGPRRTQKGNLELDWDLEDGR